MSVRRKVQSSMTRKLQIGERATDASTAELPLWDLGRLYPGLDSIEFKRGVASLLDDISELEREFDGLQIGWGPPLNLDQQVIRDLHSILSTLNAVYTQHESITAYLYCHVTTDSRDDLAQARLSELRQRGIAL